MENSGQDSTPSDGTLPKSTQAATYYRERQRHWLEFPDSTTDGVLALDADGRILEWNVGAEKKLGWTRQEALGQRLSELVVPIIHRSVHDEEMRRCLACASSHVVERSFLMEVQHKDGRSALAELKVWPIWRGDQLGLGALIRDATGGQNHEKEFSKFEERYRLFVEHLGEGMLIVQKHVVVFCNEQACDILKVSTEDLSGRNPFTWVLAEDMHIVSALQRDFRDGRSLPVHSEFRVIDGAGETRWVDMRPKTISWNDAAATLLFFSDITEKKVLQEELRRSEERYRAVIEHVDSGMVVLQGDKLVYANRRASEIVQMSVNDILSVGYLHRIHPDDQQLIENRRRKRLAGESVPGRYEVRLLFPDRHIRWIELGVSLVPWDGKPATITFFQDVTDRRSISDALKKSQERYRAVVEHSGEGLLVMKDDRFDFINNRAAEIVGMSVSEMMQRGYWHLVHPEDRGRMNERRLKRLAGESVPDRFEARITLGNGQLRWLDIGVTVVPWDDAVATLIFFSDVTERKTSEEQLKRTSAEREAILQSALAGIVLTMDRRIQWVNDKFVEMVGYSREELIGMSSLALHPDEQTWQELGTARMASLAATGTFNLERELKRRDGSIFWVETASRCLLGNNPSSGVITTFLDITHRIKAAQDTRAALEQQKELNELRSRFVAMTSHEFRTPLATILSSADLLQNYSDRIAPSERTDILKTIEGGVHRMTRMLDRVLLLSKADAKLLELSPHWVNVTELATQLVDEVTRQHAAPPGSIQMEFPQNRVEGMYDAKLLGHIFTNLLGNALKYSPHGGQVTFSLKTIDSGLQFEVNDQGIGIPTDEIPHLFESFHRASNVGHIPGTGLGLAIVKNAVSLHGGQIAVKSEPGQGTCFTVTILSAGSQ
jgi:PAS domain S-box-containing protein